MAGVFLFFLFLHLLREQFFFYKKLYAGKEDRPSIVDSVIQGFISFLIISALFVLFGEIVKENRKKEKITTPYPRVLEKETKYFSVLWPKGTVLTTTYNAQQQKHTLIGLSSPTLVPFHDLKIKTLHIVKEGYKVETKQPYALEGWRCEAGTIVIDTESKLQECTLETPAMLGHIEIRGESHVLVSTHAYYARHRSTKTQKDVWVLAMKSVRIKGKHFKSVGLMYKKDKIKILYAFEKSLRENKETLLARLKGSKQ